MCTHHMLGLETRKISYLEPYDLDSIPWRVSCSELTRILHRSSLATLDCFISEIAVTKVSIALAKSAENVRRNIWNKRHAQGQNDTRRQLLSSQLLASETALAMALLDTVLFLLMISSNSASLIIGSCLKTKPHWIHLPFLLTYRCIIDSFLVPFGTWSVVILVSWRRPLGRRSPVRVALRRGWYLWRRRTMTRLREEGRVHVRSRWMLLYRWRRQSGWRRPWNY